jgi:integrase
VNPSRDGGSATRPSAGFSPPLRACLATARREGLVRHNAAAGAVVPHRPQIREDENEGRPRALSREQVSMFLAVVHPDYRLMFRFLAATGLRFSEMVALRWRDLVLDGSQPRAKVRRAIVRGTLKDPKSEHGRRDVPLSTQLADELRAARPKSRWSGDDDPVFASVRGNPPNYANLLRRYLKPAAEEVGVPWAGFHTFRHTCASLLFDGGRNIRQVQKWLGNHATSFTLDTYVHLLDEGVGEGLDLGSELRSNNRVTTGGSATEGTEPQIGALESALSSGFR